MNNFMQTVIGYPYHAINWLRRQYLSRNPYLAHVQMFIDHGIIPYRTVKDIKRGKVDRRKVAKILCNISIMLLNLFRFVVIASFERKDGPQVREYFVELFASQPNHSFFYMTLVLLFLCPTVCCEYI